jgi:hypothetical protein
LEREKGYVLVLGRDGVQHRRIDVATWGRVDVREWSADIAQMSDGEAELQVTGEDKEGQKREDVPGGR